MKKRLSKLALLAVAAAFIVAGFPACSDEEEPEPPAQATAAFALADGDSVALTAGEPQDVTATLTVTNTAFSEAVKELEAGASLADYITLSAGDKVSVDAKLAEKVEGNTMKITLSVTTDADAAAGTGEIKATLKAAALTAAKDVAATGAISYTVTPADPDAPKATFVGENIPEAGVSLAVGEEKTGDATITVTNTTFSDAVKALNEGDAIPDTLLALNAGDKVTVSSVKVAAKANDTTMKITLAVTAGESTGTGAIKATLKAAALTTENDVTASGNIAYTVKNADKPDETVYFTSFVASELGDTGKTGPFTSADGLVTIGARSTYQVGENYKYDTADYDEEAGKGYAYTARVKINTTNSNGAGTLTIKPVKVGDILRIDGGNGSGNGDVRKMSITGAGATETEWVSTVPGSFYLTATADTIILESKTNEFCIYGIHVVDEKVAESIVDEKMTYANPTLTLSAPSVAQDGEVTITAMIPDATKTTTYSTGRVVSDKESVNETITYAGATVTNGKVDTSSQGTLTITASYTVGEATYTSEAVTLEVTKSFESKNAEVANDDDTLGLTAGEVTSANESIATAEISGSNIVITSHSAGATTITASDSTKKAKIDVTVKADGEIETKVRKYPVIETITWAVPDKDTLSGISTLAGLEVGSVEGYVVKAAATWADEKAKFKYDGDTSYTAVATFTTTLKTSASDSISNGNYAQVVITNNTGNDITLSDLEYTHSIKDKPGTGTGTGTYGCQAFYWIGDVTGNGNTLTSSTYSAGTSAILTKAKVSFAEDTVVKNGQSVTIRFAYYGGNNSNKVCALKDVVLSVK